MPESSWRKRVLIAVCASSACLMIAELALARRIHRATLDIWQIELLVLPWVFFVGSYLAIVATSWFDSDGGGMLIRKALSVIVAAGVMGLVTVSYFGLIF